MSTPRKNNGTITNLYNKRKSSTTTTSNSSDNISVITMTRGIMQMTIGMIFGFSLHYFMTLSSPSDQHTSSALRVKDAISTLPKGEATAAAIQQQHPKWKLWHTMTPSEQQEALDKLQPYVEKYSTLIQGKNAKKKKHGNCETVMMGKGGEHALCGPAPTEPCNFISFGINDDPSFDIDLANRWGCRGFASDPTVHHPSKIHPNVTFHNIGATLLVPNEERLINKGGTSDWWETSMPSLRKFLKIDYIDILKLDCEGCEISLARDILAEDPTFLHHVGQISIETHVTRTWINTTEHVYYFALMFPLLEEAGFQMETSSIFGCSKRHEVAGCHPDLLKTTFPCGYKPWPGHPKVVLGRSCHDFLFKRYPLAES